jgi:hypothetical protein
MKNASELLQRKQGVLINRQQAPDQRGSVLIIGLIVLLGVMTLSIAGMQTVVLNERMASNAIEAERENHLAESAIQYARGREDWVNTAIGNSPNNTVHDFAGFLDDAQLRTIPTMPSSVRAGLLGRSGSAYGYSDDFDFQLINVYGKAESVGANSGGKIVQGFLTITAKKGNGE